MRLPTCLYSRSGMPCTLRILVASLVIGACQIYIYVSLGELYIYRNNIPNITVLTSLEGVKFEKAHELMLVVESIDTTEVKAIHSAKFNVLYS